MPADSNAKDSDPDATGDTPGDTPGDSAGDASGETDGTDVPLNRAERRGQGKKGSRPNAGGRGKVAGKSSGVQNPRMWTNRRGGG